MLLAITKFELQDIRKAILSASKREEGYQGRLSDGLRVINAILSKKIEVIPVSSLDVLTLEEIEDEELDWAVRIDQATEDFLAEQEGDY